MFFQGISVKPVVNALKVKRQSEDDPSLNEKIHETVSMSNTGYTVCVFDVIRHSFIIFSILQPVSPSLSVFVLE